LCINGSPRRRIPVRDRGIRKMGSDPGIGKRRFKPLFPSYSPSSPPLDPDKRRQSAPDSESVPLSSPSRKLLGERSALKQVKPELWVKFRASSGVWTTPSNQRRWAADRYTGEPFFNFGIVPYPGRFKNQPGSWNRFIKSLIFYLYPGLGLGIRVLLTLYTSPYIVKRRGDP
jgi:hypothetical protein